MYKEVLKDSVIIQFQRRLKNVCAKSLRSENKVVETRNYYFLVPSSCEKIKVWIIASARPGGHLLIRMECRIRAVAVEICTWRVTPP